MGFVIMFVAAWAAAFVLYSMSKSLSISENAFVYLVILSLDIHISWIVAQEFKLMDITRNGLLYAGYLMYRSIALPLTYVILCNAVFKARTIAVTLVSMGVALCVLLALTGLLRFYEVFHYKQWNVWFDIVQILALQGISLGLLRLYRKTEYRGVDANDTVGTF